MERRGRWVALGWALLLFGCTKDETFLCGEDSECVEAGVAGMCQPNSLCSFPELGCPSGQKYGMHAGTLSGECVADGDTDTATGTAAASVGGNTSGASTTTAVDPSADSSGDGATTDPMSTSTGGGGGLPNGSTCNADRECESGKCYPSALTVDVCGECLSDADCPNGGCNPPSPFDPNRTPSACNNGELGDACETDDVCAFAAHSCVSLVDVPGFFTVSTCSECATDDECMGSDVCNMFLDTGSFAGGFECVAPSSIGTGGFCTLGGSGEIACIQHCAQGTINGFFDFGVCSPCSEDAHCAAGQTCVAPEVDFGSGAAIAAMCQ